ncbi:hypothetical protein DB346_20105 [Verrucomicrobia bacterium LW23]|nr:hypothetical protein DB346_20105 [Verrucomicrobia bacterium LW23]
MHPFPNCSMSKIAFLEDDSVTVVHCNPQEQTLLDASLAAGLHHFHACAGQARCSTCRVLVVEGLDSFGPRTPMEAALAAHYPWADNVRLACQSRPAGPATVRRLVQDTLVANLALGPNSGQPVAEERRLGLLFCDISNFTAITQGHLAYDVVHSLNRFFKLLGDPILANHGTIDKYLGDGMFALFGLDNPTHDECARRIVRAALRMVSAAQALNENLQNQFGFSFEPRIGIHYGPVLVGHQGHPSRMSFTVIGDAVNTASRIEASNKIYGTRLLASEDLVAPILPSLEIGRTLETELRGRSGSVRMYEILGYLDSDPLYLVQSTFELLAPKADAFAIDFYEHMFALKPELEPLFVRVEMKTMRIMLVRMIALTVQGLHNLPSITPELRMLGQRHAGYGVREEHFDYAEAALLHALALHLGEAFIPRVRESWCEVFAIIRRSMLAGFAQGAENAMPH